MFFGKIFYMLFIERNFLLNLENNFDIIDNIFWNIIFHHLKNLDKKYNISIVTFDIFWGYYGRNLHLCFNT